MPAPTQTPWGTGTAGTYYFFDQVIASEGRSLNGVVSGLSVTQSGTPSLTLQVASGIFHQEIATTQRRSYAGGTVTLSAAHATYPRVDYISIYWNGAAAALTVTAGTPDNSAPLPTVPIPSDGGAFFNIVLAVVVVYPGVTAILDEHIYDRRFFVGGSVSTTDGTAGAPAYAYTSAPTTGWWFDNAGGSLVASIAGQGRFALNAVGMVIVGNGDGGVLYMDQSIGQASRVMLATGTTPATPGSGVGALYLDSASKNISLKDDAGVVKHGVQTKASVSNNFLTAISDAGVVSAAQPAFSNLSGSVAAGQMPALTGDVTTSAGAVATTISNDAVTYAKMQNVSAASKLLGRGSASGSGDPEEITLGTNLSMSGTTLNASGGGGGSTPTGTGFVHVTAGVQDGAAKLVDTADVNADQITYAKLQNVSAASKLLGRGSAGGSGDPEEITVGTNLSMSGTTLSAAVASVDTQVFTSNGTWTKPANAQTCYLWINGGGGGGGGGQGAAAGAVRSGGGGGGGGFGRGLWFRASDLSATEAVVVGAGGTGGAGGSSAAGVDGTTGGTSSFGTAGTNYRAEARGGGGGAGNTAGGAGGSGAGGSGAGTDATAAAGVIGGGSLGVAGGPATATSQDGTIGAGSLACAVGGSAGNSSTFGGASGSGSATAGAAANAPGGSSYVSGAGGGCGGGVNAATPGTAQNGQQGGASGPQAFNTGGGGQGGLIAGSGIGSNGQAATIGHCGGGGGGGGSSNSTTGFAGGTGGEGSGGGGGGGGTSTGGRGGDGGSGLVIVVTFCTP